jgi:hypothetical protein
MLSSAPKLCLRKKVSWVFGRDVSVLSESISRY